MLSGMTSVTSGDASILGYDVSTEIDQIRKSLGVCPQVCAPFFVCFFFLHLFIIFFLFCFWYIFDFIA